METADHKADNSDVQKDLTPLKARHFHPGHIRYACMRDGGSYSGCKLAAFSGANGVHAVDKCNEFFEGNENLTVMDMWYENNEVVVLYTNFMDPEEKADFDDAAEELRGIMQRKREERRKAQMDTATAEEKESKEAKRLQEVGRKCEANHGKLARKGKR